MIFKKFESCVKSKETLEKRKNLDLEKESLQEYNTACRFTQYYRNLQEYNTACRFTQYYRNLQEYNTVCRFTQYYRNLQEYNTACRFTQYYRNLHGTPNDYKATFMSRDTKLDLIASLVSLCGI